MPGQRWQLYRLYADVGLPTAGPLSVDDSEGAQTELARRGNNADALSARKTITSAQTHSAAYILARLVLYP